MALGEAIGPLLAVFISSRMTPHSMFMISAVIGIMVAFIALIILRSKVQTGVVKENTPSLKLVPEKTNSGTEIVVLVRSEHD